MTTIVNTPQSPSTEQSSMGWVVGIVALIVFTLLFFVYGVPMIRRVSQASAPQVTIPDKVDVNVNTNPSE